MACGVPVVASPVGVNSHIVSDGHDGYLATSLSEWYQSLKSLIANAPKRVVMGAAARAKVAREYCLSVTAPRIAQILQRAVQGAARDNEGIESSVRNRRSH
jgi:glycosyltransferase involved in cell wall biosynthesis